jgi:hypothetical protein
LVWVGLGWFGLFFPDGTRDCLMMTRHPALRITLNLASR